MAVSKKKALALGMSAVIAAGMAVPAFAESVTQSGGTASTDVTGTYVAAEEMFNVDITWGSMDFTYTAGTFRNDAGTWSLTEGAANNITVLNKSNVAIDAALVFNTTNGAGINIEGKITADNDTETDAIDKLSLDAATAEDDVTQTATAYLNIISGSITETCKLGELTVTVTKQTPAA